MIDLKLIMKNKNSIKTQLAKRGNFNVAVIEKLFKAGERKSRLHKDLEGYKANLNDASKKIGFLNREGKNVELKKELKNSKKIKKNILKTEKIHRKNEETIQNLLLATPNIPLADVPEGKDETDNHVENQYLENQKGQNHKSHFEIAKKLDILDFERAAKMAGARFAIYKKEGAKILRALQNFCLDENTKKGYEELELPVIVNTNSLYGTGQLPKFAEDLFRLTAKDKWLIPTAEATLTNFHANEIVNLEKPIKYTAYSSCFRSEAGAGGKDQKGLMRLHQFHKIELFKLTTAEQKDKEFNSAVADVEDLLVKLELPYQKVVLCAGDLGFSSEYTVDLEVWFPSQNKYREVSSISKFGDFQSRRAKIRYKKGGKSTYASTINGSGLALERIIAALIENKYNEQLGKVIWPSVIQKYLAK